MVTNPVAWNNRNVFSIVLKARSPTSRQQQDPQEVLGENSFLTSSSIWWLPVFLGVPWLVTTLFQSLPLSSCHLLYLTSLVIRFKIHPNPGWFHLKILNHVCKDLFSKQGHTHRFHLNISWGGRGSFNLLSSVQFSHSVVSDFLQPREPQHARPPCSSPTPGVHPNPCPLRPWCHPTISSSLPLLPLPSIFPSIRVFSNESTLRIRWPKYWNFSFSISLSNGYLGLISFRMNWFDLLAVQGTLKSLLQYHSSKASVPWCSAFFTVQLSHPYMTTGKTIALTRWTFVGKGMSLLFNMLTRLVITFLPRSKHFLISWLQSPLAMVYLQISFIVLRNSLLILGILQCLAKLLTILP